MFTRCLTTAAALYVLASLVCPGPALGDAPLVVGTKQAPPFAMGSADGVWTGMSIELWRAVAAEMGLQYEFREVDLEGLVGGLTDGSIDVGVAALTVTEEREAAFDFTHPFHSAGLGIAVRPRGGRWLTALGRFVSLKFLAVIAMLVLLLCAIGALVWLFEHRRNAAQFGGSPVKGIGAAFWWAAVTMTTVGYGDKAPLTPPGRAVALVWMFAGLILISAFTAAITSALTISGLESAVRGPEDLPHVRVATVSGTTSQRYLARRGVAHRAFDTAALALGALATGDTDAVVYDGPILRHLAMQMESPVRVLATTFARQDYAIGLKADRPLREPLNRAMLRAMGDPAWEQTVKRYLGG